jgi:adenylate kinase family enzyme
VSSPAPCPRLRRVAVVGTSGSGKTTLARRVSERLGLPHVELDALHWEPNWTPTEPEVFCARTAQALSGPAWVTDGNYGKVRGIVWSRADTVVWLDFPLPVIMGRMMWRTVRRLVCREELWNQNRENLAGAFLSRDSIILWALRTYRRRRREYPVLLGMPEHAHLEVVHLHSPREARRWLASLPLSPHPKRQA